MKCCICKNNLEQEERNNPRPLKDKGYCCDRCNKLVIIRRIELMKGGNNI